MIIAGSPGMAGAAVLASEAAYRSGAGLVYLYVPQSIADVVAIKQTCAIVRAQEDTHEGLLSETAVESIVDSSKTYDVALVGPGLGPCGDAIREIVGALRIPCVLDADGINAFASRAPEIRKNPGTIVLTPHPGELSRLLDLTVRRIQAGREKLTKSTAQKLRCILALKGAGTVVSDGKRTRVNQTGNPGMATGGSGDVLGGMIAGLLGQKMKPFDATVLGVYLHGLAGDLAAEKEGEISLMATDILDWVSHAFERHRARTQLADA